MLRHSRRADVLIADVLPHWHTDEGQRLQVHRSRAIGSEVDDDDGVLAQVQLGHVHAANSDQVGTGGPGVAVTVRITGYARRYEREA